MKSLVVKMVEGVPLIMTQLQADNFPAMPLDEVPHFCGPKDGLGEKVIPDSILTLYIAIACWIHDGMFCILSPRKDNWYVANGVLLLNILMLIIVKGSKIMVVPRSLIALLFFWGVMTGEGWKCFTDRVWLKDYDPYEDKELINKFSKVGVHLAKPTGSTHP